MLLTWRWRPAIELNPTQPKAGAMMKSKTPSLLSVISHTTRKKKNRKKKMRVWVKGSEDTKKKNKKKKKKIGNDNGQRTTEVRSFSLTSCNFEYFLNSLDLNSSCALLLSHSPQPHWPWGLPCLNSCGRPRLDHALRCCTHHFFPLSSYSSWFGISKNWHLSPRARTPFAFGSNPKSQRRSLSLLLSSLSSLSLIHVGVLIG